MTVIINTIIIIISNYMFLFILSFKIFCSSNKILTKIFGNIFIINFPTFNF